MHVFYDIQKLKLAQRKKVLNDAFIANDSWRVDELDCSKSWCRQPIEMSFEDIMKKFNNGCHFTVIHRKDIMGDEYGEVGFCEMCAGVNHFLWIYLTVSELDKLVSKYSLQTKV